MTDLESEWNDYDRRWSRRFGVLLLISSGVMVVVAAVAVLS